MSIYERLKSPGSQIPDDDMRIADGSGVLKAEPDENNECTARKQNKEWNIPVNCRMRVATRAGSLSWMQTVWRWEEEKVNGDQRGRRNDPIVYKSQ